MFYSVDVETASTTVTPGALLTVGVVAVDKVKNPHGEEVWAKVDTFYVHLAYDEQVFDKDTIENFWNDEEKVSEEAKKEAFDWTLNRLHPASAAVMLADWVSKLSPQKESFFVANPASFDYPWVDALFSNWGVKTPFSHRSLCLRSMAFGMNGGEYGQKREGNHEPTVPHHALYDANAQADDLIDMLNLL